MHFLSCLLLCHPGSLLFLIAAPERSPLGWWDILSLAQSKKALDGTIPVPVSKLTSGSSQLGLPTPGLSQGLQQGPWYLTERGLHQLARGQQPESLLCPKGDPQATGARTAEGAIFFQVLLFFLFPLNHRYHGRVVESSDSGAKLPGFSPSSATVATLPSLCLRLLCGT